MPLLGLAALFRFAFRTARVLWARPEFRGLLGVTLAVVAAGAAVFKTLEPAQFGTWTDAVYFTVITLTTVGYGDFSPQTTAGKWFAIFYIFMGLGLIGGFIGVIGEAVLDDARRRSGADREPPAESSS